ncbi:hypothetical protein AMTRI_Chr10g6240 [Amborella trichopoda]|uniref:RNase III domain-containing protein n=1 Tax=Amborella trichopoda TaxID=13333 RepID=W1NXS8_AMBTC|nr:protein NUCLEAR FUSION DEFECTIVE 2 [Amborella trichopoda]XP_020518855.1 protein NUCLEAR FUSION DEFECTIVE 2 [Amborella trichopoda]ERM99494.1 hypothetical protein AMTR_s00088p00026020 [Amborella trichopoda]|eukprot:XP_006836641.1 protein NUCLEAR FUSION DEFECTIVE 2 [Amborella trichopoda]
MDSIHLILLPLLLFLSHFPLVTEAQKPVAMADSPFSDALKNLQKQIGYQFQDPILLQQAMTHASFSIENNKALHIAGVNLIETAITLKYLNQNRDIEAKDLALKLLELTTEKACKESGVRLGLQKVVRVATRTDTSTAICGAFRALFGAIALDSGKADAAIDVFSKISGSGLVFYL